MTIDIMHIMAYVGPIPVSGSRHISAALIALSLGKRVG
jgi:hypothetical protein